MRGTRPDQAESSGTWLVLTLLALVLVLHACINAWHISDKLFWLDEASTWQIAARPLAEIVPALGTSHLQPPLFYWLGHVVMSFGDSPVVLRGISFSLIAGTLAFAMLGLRELSIPSRLLLSTLLALSPVTAYISTEFRPYALAVFFILLSSVLLFRAILPTRQWGPAAWYGFSALGLQYSLLLNCWVFACQMLVAGIVVLNAARTSGARRAWASHGRLISTCAMLSISYAMFLAWTARAGSSWSPRADLVALGSAWSPLQHNIQTALVPTVMAARGPAGLVTWAAIGLFSCGIVLAFRRNVLLAAYLLSIFIGQLVFSTYLLYARIDGFHFRYLTASFVAFALLAALGYEFLVARRWPGRGSFAAPLLLLVLVFPGALDAFNRVRQMPPERNPYRVLLDDVPCPGRQVLVYCQPAWSCSPAIYEFRRSAEVRVPASLSIDQLRMARQGGQCIFVLTWRAARKGPAEQEALSYLDAGSGLSKEVIDLYLHYPQLANSNLFPDYLRIYRPAGVAP